MQLSVIFFFSHCAAMCVLIALAVCNGPLLYDYTLIYKGSLDGTVLACVIGTILHLFLWIVLWLFLTVKQKWTFKLRVTIGRSMVKNARSIKLVNDIGIYDYTVLPTWLHTFEISWQHLQHSYLNFKGHATFTNLPLFICRFGGP